jgi:hypothetical protein
MIRTVALAFLLTGASCCIADPPQHRQATAAAGLELHISAKETSLTQGEQPQIHATITNKGAAPVTLVLPGDGSESGWRTPLVGFSSVKAGRGKPKHPAEVPLYRGGRCGNVNPLKGDEVFSLAPGQSKDLGDWVGSPRLAEPGTYGVVLYYANDPGLKWRGVPLGRHDADAMRQVARSYKCLLVSNELRLTVRAKQ